MFINPWNYCANGTTSGGNKTCLMEQSSYFHSKKKKKRVETVKEEKHGECIKTASGQNVF